MGPPVEFCISMDFHVYISGVSCFHHFLCQKNLPFHSRSAPAMHPIVDSTQVLRGRALDEVSTHTREELADAVSLVVLWHSLMHDSMKTFNGGPACHNRGQRWGNLVQEHGADIPVVSSHDFLLRTIS